MTQKKIEAGSRFPSFPAKNLQGEVVDLSKPANGTDWKMIVIYRGRHCPLCTKYLNELEGHIKALKKLGIDTVAVSADSQDQLQDHLSQLNVSFPLYYGLSLEQMKQLGLYISIPRSEKETDHLFPEPGLFVINAEGNVQVVDLSNNPFVRPTLTNLVNGLGWIRDPENNYPIRGTYGS